MEEMDCYVGIRGSDNVSELCDVPADKMAYMKSITLHLFTHDVRVKKTRWVVLRYPNSAMAQLADTVWKDLRISILTL